MSDPTVTVIIPCHNHRNWVWGAIESVARQTYSNKRVVLVDDGSIDGSFEYVGSKLYQPKALHATVQGNPEGAMGTFPNSGMKVYMLRYPEAHGPSFARNRGMEALGESTELFGFLDSDDEYRPRKLEVSVKKILSDPLHVGAVYTDYETLNPDGRILRVWGEPFSRQRLLQECIVNPNNIVSREAVAEVGGFDESLRTCEDYDYWLRLSEKYLIVHVAECLATKRIGPHDSTSTVHKEVWHQNWQRVMLKARDRAGGLLS